MSKTVRVTCTIPAEVLRAADRVAARLDRSRSWVVSEALRRLDADVEPGPPPALRRAFRVAERSRLERDLALTPADRVRLSEKIARSAPAAGRKPRRDRVLQFDTFEAYLDWKRFAGLAP